MDERPFEEERILEYIQENLPTKTLVELSEYEDEFHQTYKFLYEKLRKQHEELEMDFHDLRFDKENLDKEVIQLKADLQKQQDINSELKNQTMTFVDFINAYNEKEIVVSNIKVFSESGNEIELPADGEKKYLEKDISLNPGVYGYKRPSWFTPLATELSKENVVNRTINNTKDLLEEKVSFWEKILKKLQKKEIDIEAAADTNDLLRRTRISELLNSDCSNDEKYVKYILLTPGMSKDFMKTLSGASEMGIDARIVIKLLEQPEGIFNQEILEAYISKVHKATDYNLKKELAKELIRGEWYIVSDINGIPQKYQLVPFEMIDDIKNKLSDIRDILLGKSCGNNSKSFSENEEISSPDMDEFVDFEPDDIEVGENLVTFDEDDESWNAELEELL